MDQSPPRIVSLRVTGALIDQLEAELDAMVADRPGPISGIIGRPGRAALMRELLAEALFARRASRSAPEWPPTTTPPST